MEWGPPSQGQTGIELGAVEQGERLGGRETRMLPIEPDRFVSQVVSRAHQRVMLTPPNACVWRRTNLLSSS